MLNILFWIIGSIIWGMGLGVALSNYLMKRYIKKNDESIMRVIIDVEELKKQMEEDEQ